MSGILCLLLLLSSGERLELSLDDAVRLAIERNLEVQSALEGHEVAYGKLVEARSGFFPQLTLTGSYTYLSTIQEMETYRLVRLEPDPQNPGSFIPVFEKSVIPFGFKNNYSLSFSIQQILFSWGRVLNSYKLAKHNLKSSDYEIEAKKEQVKEKVKGAYFNCLLAKEYLDVLKEVKRDLEEHYRSVKKRYEEGAASDFELLRAEVQKRNVESQIKEAEAGYKTALDLLKMMLNVSYETEIVLTETLSFKPYPANLDSLVQVALKERYDLKSTSEKIKMLERMVAIANAGNKPTVFAQWAYQYQRPFGFEDEWHGMWNFTVGFQFPFFDGLKSYGQTKSTRAQLRQLRYVKLLQEKGVELEIRSLYRDLESKSEALVSQEGNVSLARRAFEMAEEQYKNGYVSSLEVLDAEVAYMQAKLSYLATLAQYNIALAKLERALKAGSGEMTEMGEEQGIQNQESEQRKQNQAGGMSGRRGF